MRTFKRKVLHLGGFDPRGARFNHQLLGEQVVHANGMAETRGEELRLDLSSRRRAGQRDSVWEVTRSDGAGTTQFQFLAWDDIVRAHWPKGALTLVSRMLTAYWRYLVQGRWRETGSVPRGSKIALIFPGMILARSALAITLLAWLALLPVFLWLHWPWGLALIPALAVGVGLGLAQVERSNGLWLLRFILFNDVLAQGRTDAVLAARLAEFAATISASLDQDWDEVLLVTHSNGSILAMPVMARLLEMRREKLGPEKLGPEKLGQAELPDHFSLVTLGGSIPLVGFRRDAGAFHLDLDRVAAANFRWLDIGSITDGASIPLVNPCLTRPVGPPPGLIQLSPRWHRYCHPATYAARRANKYLTHFDYLRRLDKPSALDYIGLTCAPRPLAESIAAFGQENQEAASA